MIETIIVSTTKDNEIIKIKDYINNRSSLLLGYKNKAILINNGVNPYLVDNIPRKYIDDIIKSPASSVNIISLDNDLNKREDLYGSIGKLYKDLNEKIAIYEMYCNDTVFLDREWITYDRENSVYICNFPNRDSIYINFDLLVKSVTKFSKVMTPDGHEINIEQVCKDTYLSVKINGDKKYIFSMSNNDLSDVRKQSIAYLISEYYGRICGAKIINNKIILTVKTRILPYRITIKLTGALYLMSYSCSSIQCTISFGFARINGIIKSINNRYEIYVGNTCLNVLFNSSILKSIIIENLIGETL